MLVFFLDPLFADDVVSSRLAGATTYNIVHYRFKTTPHKVLYAVDNLCKMVQGSFKKFAILSDFGFTCFISFLRGKEVSAD